MAEQDEEYLHEASNAVKAIKEGTATTCGPFEYALYGRVVIEKWFEILGRIYTITQSAAVLLFAMVVVIYGVFVIGFVTADTQQDISELFLRLEDKENVDYTNRFISGAVSTVELALQYRPNLDSNFSGSLLDHITLMRSAIDLPVEYNGR